MITIIVTENEIVIKRDDATLTLSKEIYKDHTIVELEEIFEVSLAYLK